MTLAAMAVCETSPQQIQLTRRSIFARSRHRGIPLVPCNGDPETLAKLLNRRSEVWQTLRIEGLARGEPIALHALCGVDDSPEACGLELPSVIVGLFAP